jgi:hypothetical protein
MTTKFQILNHYSDSDLVIYTLCTFAVCFIGYLATKSYFYNAPIETPSSPQTFNLSADQIQTLNKIIERWDELENVNEDLQTIIGEEVFDRMENKFEDLENEIEDRFEELENELLDSVRYPFENELLDTDLSENLINSPFEELNLLEISNLIADLTNFQFCLLALIIVFLTISWNKDLAKIFNDIRIVLDHYNILKNSLYGLSILIPFSSFDIDFRDSFEWKFNSYRVKPKISYLSIQTLTQDINDLLDSLEDDANFSMSLSFISSYKEWKDNKEKVYPLFVNDAIIVNKESDPVLITEFIIRSLNDKGLLKTNWLFKDHLINSMDPIILTVTVRIKVII